MKVSKVGQIRLSNALQARAHEVYGAEFESWIKTKKGELDAKELTQSSLRVTAMAKGCLAKRRAANEAWMHFEQIAFFAWAAASCAVPRRIKLARRVLYPNPE